MNLTDKKIIKNILSHYGLRLKKSLGQHFLINEKILNKIIDSADITKKDQVLEIGPGLGILTNELCERAGKVIAVEKDEKLAKILKRTTKEFNNLEIINQDILRTKIYNLQPRTYKLVANLPYNIAGPILRKFLESENKPFLMILMLQKEVAEKIVAAPGQMSILSVSVRFYADSEIIEIVPDSDFWPSPKVDSAIIKISNIKKKSKIDTKNFFRCVRIGFSSPRKTLLNNLAAGYKLDKENIKNILEKIKLNEFVRAQELSINDWQKLIRLI